MNILSEPINDKLLKTGNDQLSVRHKDGAKLPQEEKNLSGTFCLVPVFHMLYGH